MRKVVLFFCFFPLFISNYSFAFDIKNGKLSILVDSFEISGHIYIDDKPEFPVNGVKVTFQSFEPGVEFIGYTDGTGNYKFKVPSGIYGTITPTKDGYTFTPGFNTDFNQMPVSANSTVHFTASFFSGTISGTVYENGAPLSGVTITMTGTSTGVAVTGTDGKYILTVKTGDNIVITPSKTGYTFSPSDYSNSNVSAEETVNFTATRITYWVWGIISENGNPLAGVSVTKTGTSTETVSTDVNGKYMFTVYQGDDVIITPTMTGYSFNPVKYTINAISTWESRDFTASKISITISGILTLSGAPLSGVILTMSGSSSGTFTTETDGRYTLTAKYGDNIIITPTKTGYSFSPNNFTSGSLTSDQTQDFSATAGAYTISGVIAENGNPLSGVTVTISGTTSETLITGVDGKYSFTSNHGNSVKITPTRTGYSFSPSDFTVNPVTSNQTNNFSASKLQFTVSGSITENGTPLLGAIVTLGGSSNAKDTTESDGKYSLTLKYGDVISVSASKSGYFFSPLIYSTDTIKSNQTKNFTAIKGITLGGVISNTGNPVNGVLVTLSGDSSSTLLTGTNGAYSFLVLPGKNYTITPGKTGYIFIPVKKDFSSITSDQTQNFSSTRLVALSGVVTRLGTPLSGTTITISGDTTGSISTGTDGSYQFLLIPGKNYTITPGKSGYTFNALKISYTSISTDTIKNILAYKTVIADGFVTFYNAPIGGTPSPLSGVTMKFRGMNTDSSITKNDGYYSISIIADGESYITPSKPGYIFRPVEMRYNNLTSDTRTQWSAFLDSVVISGKISFMGQPLSGVNINLSGYLSGPGSVNKNIVTDNSGSYSFKVERLGVYTITPTKQNYTFTPQNKIFTNIEGNQIQDFTAGTELVTISGIITKSDLPIENAIVNLSGSLSGLDTTSTDGKYSFKIPVFGNYTIKPQKPAHLFIPSDTTFTNLLANQIRNFDAYDDTVEISGITALLNGTTPIGNVNLVLRGTKNGSAINISTISDSFGKYKFRVPSFGSYEITANLVGYKFSSPTKAYSMIETYQLNQNFTAEKTFVTISGKVVDSSGLGAKSFLVTLKGNLESSKTTDPDGLYSFSVPYGGSYSIEPSKSNYRFRPEGLVIVSLFKDTSNQDFTAIIDSATISGVVIKSENNAFIGGALIKLSNGDSTRTAYNGRYSFRVKTENTYTVTLVAPGYRIVQDSKTFTNLLLDQTLNFSVSLDTVLLKGSFIAKDKTPVTNVIVSLNGNVRQTLTSTDGTYSFKVPCLGDYTIVPRKARYKFNPDTLVFKSLTAESTNNIEGLFDTVSVSGIITDSDRNPQPISNAKITLISLTEKYEKTVFSDLSGKYSLLIPLGRKYSIVLTKNGYSFVNSIRETTPFSDTTLNLTGNRMIVNLTWPIWRKKYNANDSCYITWNYSGFENGRLKIEYTDTRELNFVVASNVLLTDKKFKWIIPDSLESTTHAKFKITLESDSIVSSTTEEFEISSPKTLSLKSPASKDMKLIYGKKYEIEFGYTGRIKNVRLMIKQSGHGWSYVKEFSNTGPIPNKRIVDWIVDIIPPMDNSNSNYYMKITDADDIAVFDTGTGYPFTIKFSGEFSYIGPENDTIKTTYVKPVFEWSYIPQNKFEVLTLKWYLDVSTDRSFSRLVWKDTLILRNCGLQGSWKVIDGPEFRGGTIFFWRVKGEYQTVTQSGLIENTEISMFKTETKTPEIPIIVAPLNGYVIDDGDGTTHRFEWQRPARTSSYQFQITEDTIQPIPKLIDVYLSGADSFWSGQLTFIDGKKYYWRVNARNEYGAGSWTKYNNFYMKSRCQTVGEVNVCSDDWVVQPDGTIRGNNPMIKNASGTHKAVLKNGYVIINKEKTTVNTAWGEVNLICPTLAKEIPLFKGFVSLSYNTITPLNVINNIDTTLFGKLPKENLVFDKIDLAGGRALFNYNKLEVDLPGIRVVDSETQSTGELVHFHPSSSISLNDQGSIYGTAEDFMIEVGTILLKFMGVQINGTATGTVTFSSTNYKVNYMRFLGDATDIPEWGGITITSDKNIAFNNDVIGCPDFDIQIPSSSMSDFGFGFQLPKMNFRFVPEMSSWVLDINASVTLPISFSSTSTASGATSGITASAGGSCAISGSTALISTAPYFHDFHFSAEGCWEVEVFPFVSWTGLSGYVDLYSENSRITGFGLGGSVSLAVKVPVIPLSLVTGTMYVDINSLGLFKLSGECYTFGVFPMNKAAIWFDWADMDGVTIGASYDAYWYTGLVNAHLEGAIGLDKDIIKRPNIYFEGLARFQIPKGYISLFGLFEIPSNDIKLAEVGAQIGQFKHNNVDMGYGMQAYIEFWDLDFAAFVPLEKGGQFKVMCDMYELVRFQRSMALRRKGLTNGINNVPYYRCGINSDTIKVNVQEIGSGKLLFGIKSFQKNLPELTIINPENKIIKSSEYLLNYPEFKRDTGYAFPVNSIKGIWTVIVNNITNGADYKLIVGGGTVSPSMKIDDVQKMDNYRYKIKFSVNDPNNLSEIYFNYTNSDSSVGKTMNQNPIAKINGSSEFIWDIRNVKAGDYKIYGRISDGSRNYSKIFYPGTISVNYTGKSEAPKNFKAYRISDNRLKLSWDSDKYLINHTVLYGYQSKTYTDTIIGIRSNEYVIKATSDTTRYFAVVYGKDVNGNQSLISSEIQFSLSNALIDSIPPVFPQKPNYKVFLKENELDTLSERISLSWMPVSNAAGYKLYYSNKGSTNFAQINVGNVNVYEIFNFPRGETYIFKIQAYTVSKLNSGFSDEVEVNFYSTWDKDNDGIPDEWEIKYFGTIDFSNNRKDDPDSDGLSNGEEFTLSTNPNNADTDGDGIWDDVDVHPLSNNDNNGNGLGDDWETYYSVNDPKDDPDHDGLTNIEEYKYRTNPNATDSDGAGLDDIDEIRRGLNPSDPKDDKWVSGFVQLESFNGKIWNNSITRKDTVVLTWKTNKEKDVAGYNIIRKSSKDTYWIKLNEALVPVSPDTLSTHEYIFKDGNIQNGVSYSYFIEGVSKWGNRDSLGIYLTTSFTSVEEISSRFAEKFALYQNYPNPFNPSTTIQFSIPNEGNVNLKIYDMLGREVSTLVNKSMKPGVYTITMDAHGMSSGQYLYRLRCGDYEETKTMILLR